MKVEFLFLLFLSSSAYICHHQPLPSDTLQTGFSSGTQIPTSSLIVKWYNTAQHPVVPDEVLANVTLFMRENILVKQASTSIHLSRNCPPSQTNTQTNTQTDTHYCTGECADVTQCGPARVADEHLGRCYVCVSNGEGKRCGFTVGSTPGHGIQGHVMVYLSGQQSDRCEVDHVQAGACQVSPVHKRPIAGYINICPQHTIPRGDLANVLIHQLLHIMGISENLFDLGGGQVADFETSWGLTRDDTYILLDKQFVGAKSQGFVRGHFGCDKGYGVLLDNQDPWHSHVEERLYRGEILTVNVTEHSLFSDLTYAMLEDTGWYIAGQSRDPPFPGNLGCDILDRSCALWVSHQRAAHDNIYPFCGITSEDYTCNTGHSAVAMCQRRSHSVGTVPANFQYHGVAGNSYVAGPYKYSDYCMLFSKEESYTCQGTPQPDDLQNTFLERYGKDSACVLHDGAWHVNGAGRSKGAGCYSICCRDNNNFDVIDLGSHAHSCYQPKQTIHVSSSNNNIRGSLQCPTWEVACGRGDKSACTSAGKCMTPSLTNGQVYSSQGMYQVTIGTTLSYLCFDGYVMRGSPSSVCLGNNLFSRQVPACRRPCKEPHIEHGTLVQSLGPARLVGDTVTVTCDTDFRLEGSSVLTCTIRNSMLQKSGFWSPRPPICKKGYLAWSRWGPCSVHCGVRTGERIRTRGCSTCADFDWDSEACFANKTCESDPGLAAAKPIDPNNSMILVAVFGVFFLFAIFITTFIVWFFNKAQQNRSQCQLFNESYYFAQHNVHGFKRRNRSIDLSSEYSAASGSVKQLFTSPPPTPYTTETKISSKDSEDSLFGSGKSFHIPKIRYKNRARVFPKNLKPVQQPPTYQESVEAAEYPDLRTTTRVSTEQVLRSSTDVAKLRASIQAARVRVRNHPAVKRLAVPNPVTGGSYNPNQIPFEISEKEEENYLEDSWDFRNRQAEFRRYLGGNRVTATLDTNTDSGDGNDVNDFEIDATVEFDAIIEVDAADELGATDEKDPTNVEVGDNVEDFQANDQSFL